MAQDCDLDKNVPKKEESSAYKQKEDEYLLKWGYSDGEGGLGISRDDALASAQAASSQDRIIHIHPLAMRLFRIEVVEPLILKSDEMVQWIKHNLLFERGQEDSEGEFNTMVTKFREMLRRVGVLEQNFLS